MRTKLKFTQVVGALVLAGSITMLNACGSGGGSSSSNTTPVATTVAGPTNPTTPLNVVPSTTVNSGSGSGNSGSGTAGAGTLLPASSTVSTTTLKAVVLPLEVMGAASSVVAVDVPAPHGSSTTQLWIQVNNLSYDNKASVQVNDGPWVTLTNANVSIQGAGQYYGGIGGTFDTLKMTVPITGGVDGTNTVRFRFNQTDDVSSGYRILAFDLQGADGTSLVDRSAFVQDDPTKWVAPKNTLVDISAGQALWETATLTTSSANPALLKAHCMDCHAANGSDLQRFNYSNYSIMERSEFHGLTQDQGLQIASYIRNLSKTLGIPGEHCRPWNPPYQPGPGLDSGDVKNWTCGAGLEAVSEKDMDTLAAIFPNGINKAAIATSGQINLREIPISLQLPDWNHWVPRIHPKDAWGDYFTNSNLNKEYNGEGTGNATDVLRQNLTNFGLDYRQEKSRDFFTDLYYWGVEFGERWSPPNVGTPGIYTIDQQKKLYSTAQWQLLKMWEMTQDFDLETNCPIAWKQIGGYKVEPRGWCNYWRFAFNVSPHILNFPPNNSMFGAPVNHYAKANQWYEMQLLLNPGNGAHNVHMPVDWQYAYGLFTDLSNASGRTEPVRNLLYIVKGAQEMAANPAGVTKVNIGWTIRDTSPLDVWKSGQNGIWKNVDPATEQAVVKAYLDTWLDKTTSFDINSWERLGTVNDNGETWCGWSMRVLCWWDYVPGDATRGASPTAENFPTWAHTQIPQMRADGIDGTSLNRFADWMNLAYPSGGFTVLKQ